MGELMQLRVVPSTADSRVQLVDPFLDLTVAEFTVIESPTISNPSSLAMGSSLVRELTRQVPGLQLALSQAVKTGGSQTIQVAFSSAVKAGLASGEYMLMRPDLPIAVNQARQTVEIAKAAHGASLAGATGPLAGAGVAGGVAVWPLVLVTAIAVAATWAEHRWLEKNFAQLHSALMRIEMRLRDDDFGAIEAADDLVDLIRPNLETGGVHEFNRIRLMVAAQEIDSIYMARRRFVERFKRTLEARQDKHEEKSGKSVGWVEDLADEIADSKIGIAEEMSVFLAAMIARARITAATARVLAVTGDPEGALRASANWEEGLRQDYYDLYRRLRALAKFEPESPRWRDLLPILKDGDNEKAHGAIKELVHRMESTIGVNIPEPTSTFILEATLEPEPAGELAEARLA